MNGTLPIGWRLTPFKELFARANRKIMIDDSQLCKCVGVRWYGMGAFIREEILGLTINRKQQWIINEGDIVYNKLFAWKGAFAVADASVDGCFVSDKFPTYVANRSLILPTYLEYYFRMPQIAEQASRLSKGAAAISKFTLNPPQFWDLTIPLPPIDEQHQIVARIQQLSAKIEEACKLRFQTVRDTEWLSAAIRESVFKFRHGWNVARVADFCEQPQYGYTESAVSDPIGPRFLRITDIQNGHVNWATVPYCQCSNTASYLLKPGDIVFARTGATTGKSFLVSECPEAVFASYLIRLRVRQSVSPEYLHQFFQSPAYWVQIVDAKRGTGQPNVNGKKLANITVPIPSVDEQREIVQYLTNLDCKIEELKRQQAQSTKELDCLLPSILDRAFKGEL